MFVALAVTGFPLARSRGRGTLTRADIYVRIPTSSDSPLLRLQQSVTLVVHSLLSSHFYV